MFLKQSARAHCALARRRKGNILILSALMIVVTVGLVAFAVDIGYILTLRADLSKAADAAALAGAASLYEPMSSVNASAVYHDPDIVAARANAALYAKYNGQGRYDDSGAHSLQLDANTYNVAGGDVVIGQIYETYNLSEPITPSLNAPNAVQVTVRLTNGHTNGPAALFFGRIFGVATTEVTGTATAYVRVPTLLPITTSVAKYNTVKDANDVGDGDDYRYVNGRVEAGSDGIPEMQVFPDNNWNGEGGMPPGNFGQLTIGPEGLASALRRQIDLGPNADDLAHHGGSLKSNDSIGGKTGVNADSQTAYVGGNADDRKYAGILGHVKLLPLYTSVSGNGSNAQFVISEFVLVRVMYAKLKGGNKVVFLQPVRSDENRHHVALCR